MWGEPPEIQTRDITKLPDSYGHGSSTLKNWIMLNKERDRLNVLLVEGKLKAVGPIMDDHDGGAAAAFKVVLQDLDVYDMILDHHHEAKEAVDTYEDRTDS